MDDASINYLANVIQQEIKHAENVLSLLFEKEKVLISNNIIGLKNIVLAEHSLFVKSRDLEVSRVSILEVVARKLSISHKNLTLKALCEKLEANYSKKMEELRSKLFNIILKIRRQNEKCELLLKKSIEIVNFSLDLITGRNMNKVKMAYDKNCKTDKKFYQQSILDKKV